ncbi:MAG: carbohydrate kinase family protein [Cellulosilyticaceae bacterium]
MTENKQPYVLVFGISICDIFGFTNDNYRSKDSNPGRVKMSYGGVCRNIAENMARVAINTKFISVLGDDDKGKCLLEDAERMHLDMTESLVVPGMSTPTYIAILDEHGEMVSAVVDINITGHLTREFVDSKAEIIKNAEYVFVGADEPELLEYMVKEYGHETRFVLDPVSAAKAQNMKPFIQHFHTIKPNRYEAEILCGFPLDSQEAIHRAGHYFRALGISEIFISLDADGIYYHNTGGAGIIKAKDVEVVNVTGAGDAFVAGLGYGYTHGLTVQETVKFAIAMSNITISHEETIHPDMAEGFVKEWLTGATWCETTF